MNASPSNFKNAEFARTVISYTSPVEHSLEDMLDPKYWSLVAQKWLTPHCRIEVIPEDGSFFAELLVTSVGKFAASVAVLRKVDLKEVTDLPAETSEFLVKYLSAKALFGVMRKADKKVVRDGFQTEAEASKWLADYEQQNSQLKATKAA